MSASRQPTDVIVLTGFLGAGKSTLLRTFLTGRESADCGVIINEFGDVAIDHDLVAEGLPEVAVTTTGCLCCTAGSDIRASIAELHDAAAKLGRLPLRRVIVETTGLANPAPVINQLVAGAVPAFGLRDHVVARHYRLAGVVAVFDAVEGPATLERHSECVKQIALADRILLTKADLLDAADRTAETRHRMELLGQINPDAPITDISAEDFDIEAAFAPRHYAPRDLGANLEGWLPDASPDSGHDHHHGHEHGHGHNHDHHHEPVRRADGTFGIGTVSVMKDEPIEKSALAHALDLAGLFYGANLLRMKGIVAFSDEPDTPHVLQVVQHVIHPLERLEKWPSEDRRTRIVAITHGIDPQVVEEMLSAMTANGAQIAPEAAPTAEMPTR
ncbi:GTP-binding protein [Acuticoccus sp. M5D2P5]|uniref:CobW family GTP-binding protein n=1 Tax=Acuticoccus kalidii TaxID=2910977 RepID=UPI001F1BCEAD|nr:GTP-binding protein [Acuticoccus kalidii]MCF3934902.1 GTP-binding protein [Acuticoccus kalidii]